MAKQFTHVDTHVDQDFRTAHDAIEENELIAAGVPQLTGTPGGKLGQGTIARLTGTVGVYDTSTYDGGHVYG